MADTIFSKIIRGEIPCHRVYNDDLVLAFMDINPLSRGHVLVIPKEPVARMEDLSEESAAALGRVLPRITKAVLKVSEAPACNLLINNGEQAGQEVPHVHLHVIPRLPSDPASGGGLSKRWDPVPIDADELADLARHIARLL